MMNLYSLFSTGLLLFALTSSVFGQDYYTYVAAESEDEVYEIHFDGETEQATINETITVGRYPTETDGPHGMTVAPDGKHWFVTIAHGNPYGYLAKYSTAANELVETTELGMFPASMEISTATGLLYVVNFNLHGDHKPSTVMVVDPETMTLVETIKTGIMPHGSRISPDGQYQYHVSMMTDELIQISTTEMAVTGSINVSTGEKSKVMHSNMGSMGSEDHAKPDAKPTWAHPHPDKPLVYVANNGSDEIVEVNIENWKITRRFETGKAPYNLEVTADGKMLVASYKGEGATGIWDIEAGKELAKIKNSRTVTHGVTISPDNRYAFISVEGKGGEPGSVDVIDLQKLEMTDYVEVGKQAGGIYFWKMEE